VPLTKDEPKTTSKTSASTGKLLIVISCFIIVFIEIFSYLIGIFTEVTFEKHIYTYYTTARYIADKPWQTLSFNSLVSPPLAKEHCFDRFSDMSALPLLTEKLEQTKDFVAIFFKD